MQEWVIGALIAFLGIALGWALSEINRLVEEKRWR